MSGRQVSEEGVEHRRIATLATDVAGRGWLMAKAGLILAVSSPALAGHDTASGGAAAGVAPHPAAAAASVSWADADPGSLATAASRKR